MPDKRRLTLVGAVLSAAAAMLLLLGWLAWGRGYGYGVDDNPGYVLLFPVFAGFFLWGLVRFRAMERDAAVADSKPLSDRGSREIPAGLLPAREAAVSDTDRAMDAYNRYLAELNARELRHHLREAGLDVFAGDRT
ncbi:transcriptional regulator [Nocardia sp. CC227C]|uniref:transcriptional regulator n=1 Tax=Nocardia sp. CC227C TaxID=3044562 RepID=UPI00278C1EB0|nr:transcriptional regulator [Nocardia sp. CC227C]